MLTAVDEKNCLINLLETLPASRSKQYFCPFCHSEVVFKNGSIKLPHFAHKQLKACTLGNENESEQHLMLKKELYEWLKETESVEIEHYLPELRQTPDLLINGKVALEIQCSPLSLKRLHERTMNYRLHGFKVVWLMGRDLWLGTRLTELKKQLLCYSENHGFHYWELDLTKRVLRLQSLIHEDLRGRLFYVTHSFSFKEKPLLDCLRTPFVQQELLKMAVYPDNQLQHFIHNQLFHKSPKWLHLQSLYYQKGKNILDLDFMRPYIAPPGLNLLVPFKDNLTGSSFEQLSKIPVSYYQNFLDVFQKKKIEILYPPRFYAIMKKQK